MRAGVVAARVRAVATANMMPLGQSGWSLGVRANADVPPTESTNVAFYFSSEDLVEALGLVGDPLFAAQHDHARWPAMKARLAGWQGAVSIVMVSRMRWR